MQTFKKSFTPILKRSSTRKKLCRHNRMMVFVPFLKPHLGVDNVAMLEKDGKIILLIGEIHNKSYENKGGLARLSDKIEDVFNGLNSGFLKESDSTLDFFLEINRMQVLDFRRDKSLVRGELNLLRQNLVEKIPMFSNDERKEVLRNERVRVHAADYKPFESTSGPPPKSNKLDILASLNQWFEESQKIKGDKYAFIIAPPTRKKDKENIIFSKYSKDFKTLYQNSYHQKSSDLSEYAVNLYFKYYNRKFEKHGCLKYKELYAKTLLQHLDYYKQTSRLFIIYRFFMDMYSLCRMLRTEGKYYKNIIFYAGLNHMMRLRTMLLGLMFKTVDLFSAESDSESDDDSWKKLYLFE